MNPRKLTNNWKGETVVCIAGGPSLSQTDVDYIKGRARCIAINDAYIKAPWADLHYACDLKWWNWHHDKVDQVTGEQWTTSVEAAKKYGIKYIRGEHKQGLSDEPDLLHYGKNSGYQAINISYLKGASRVLLLGYDMKRSGGRSHWFGDHPDKIRSNYDLFLSCFDTIDHDGKIEIVNCSPGSALKKFRSGRLQDEI